MLLANPRTRRRETVLAAASVAAHFALLAVIPIALWKLSGNPIPTRIPDWTKIQQQWRGIQEEPAQIIGPALRTIADLLWITWAWTAAWTVLAVLWVLLHLPRTVLPGTLAAITPAIALRALSLGALMASPSSPTHAVSSATAPAAATQRVPGDVHIQTADASTLDVVKPNDTLWGLAGEYYHQPEDWPRIYQANAGEQQSDGKRLDNPNFILPGWRLTIPDLPTPTTRPEPSTPAASGPAKGRTHTPTQPPNSTSKPTPHTPTGRPVETAPARRTNQPHTVGHVLPDEAGYIGITLIAAVGAAVAILRTRNRRRGRPEDEDVPDLAQHLAAVHSASRSANHYTWLEDEHPGQQPPPLYRPVRNQPALATSPDEDREIPFDLDALPGPLVLTGPGALGAARALAISTLATDTHDLHIDPDLADDLLGNDQVLPLPQQPTDVAINISPAQPDEPHGPRTVIRGNREPDETATVFDFAEDGTVRNVNGPAADQQAELRLHTLDRESAATLRAILEETEPAQPVELASAPVPTVSGQSEVATSTTVGDATDSDADLHELASVPVVVRLLGTAEILGPAEADPVPVTTEQAAVLLTLLTLHPDGVLARTLRELAWPNATDHARIRVALHTAINRTRTLLRRAARTAEEEDPITYDKVRQAYRLNSNTVTTDLALARNLTAQAASVEDRIERLDLLTRAASLHRGELAPSLDDHDRDWLTTARYTILNEAVATQLQIAEYTIENHPDRAAVAIRAAVTLAPEDHDATIAALQASAQMPSPDLARDVYRAHSNALRRLGEAPSSDITDLYKSINK